ncbi:MAG: hypothetical protein R2771_06100 [Saprospiraceae bacterium]
MENQIFEVAAIFYKSLVLRENELWVSQNKVGSLEKFEKAVNNTGMMKSAFSIPLTSISEISYNEASESTKLKYTNEKGKDKKLNIGFGDVAVSNQFGEYLGNKLGFKKSSTKEGQLKPLLLNGLYLLIAIGGTFFLGMMDDTSELTESGSRRSRNKGAFLKLIVDTVGQTGVFIIGGLISIYLAYKLYKRYKRPSNEILFTK